MVSDERVRVGGQTLVGRGGNCWRGKEKKRFIFYHYIVYYSVDAISSVAFQASGRRGATPAPATAANVC